MNAADEARIKHNIELGRACPECPDSRNLSEIPERSDITTLTVICRDCGYEADETEFLEGDSRIAYAAQIWSTHGPDEIAF
jgi:C4-type Zn-finger protein